MEKKYFTPQLNVGKKKQREVQKQLDICNKNDQKQYDKFRSNKTSSEAQRQQIKKKTS